MSRYFVARWAGPATVAAACLLVAVSLAAQTKPDTAVPSKDSAPTKAPAKAWTVSHTPDGQPDIQGIWVNFDQTPFETPPPDEVRKYNPAASYADQAPAVSKRKSMIVDPADGRLPPLTPWAAERRDYRSAHFKDAWENDQSWTRCITRGIPGGMMPVVYDNGYQILQTPGYVVILSEMIHETRVIPIDSRPHIPDSIRQWNGDSRGHWDGNTLVVETTNFNGGGMYAEYGPLIFVPETVDARIMERFTRIDAKTINYEMTVQDPRSFTAPWKVAMPMTLDNGYRMFEYACHEGNQNYMEINLGSGSSQDKGTEEKEKK
jgi:hypothetical protein